MKNTLGLAFCLFFTSVLFAQQEHITKCATRTIHENQQKLGLLENDDVFEAWMREKRLEISQRSTRRNILKVPVVVHVIHNGEAEGIAPNISDAQILSQIQTLNEDFRKMAGTPGDNTHPDGVDLEIDFELAKIDEQGNPSNGINRVEWGAFDYTDEFLESVVKPATVWNPDFFLNVWVCSVINSDAGAGLLLGYAQFPKTDLDGIPINPGSKNTDGVVINARYFGSKDLDDGSFDVDFFSRGRTLTHEIGHFLGLRHIWGDGDCSADDYCEDTPNQSGATNGCPTTKNTCGSDDMFQNYMDYSNDGCMNIFTNCQKGRVDVVMENSIRRNTLPTSPALGTNSGFSFSGRVIDGDSGQPVPHARLSFDGDFLPKVTADANGEFTIDNFFADKYDVTVGAWGYITKEVDDVTVDSNTGAVIFEINKGLEDAFALDLGWEVTGDANVLFRLTSPITSKMNNSNGAAASDPGSEISGDVGRMCYMTGAVGGLSAWSDVDNGFTRITSPEFDLTNYSYPVVSFFSWFSNRKLNSAAATPDDFLTAYLTNGTDTVMIFQQDASDESEMSKWKLREFIVQDYISITSTMKLMIETSDNVTSSNGHVVDAAIDFFSVKEGSTSTRDLDEVNQFSLNPNPTNGVLNLSFETDVNVNLEMSVLNVVGQEVLRQNLGQVNGIVNEDIDLSGNSKGIYFVQLRSGNKVKTKKIILY